jgi:hypothetical protein
MAPNFNFFRAGGFDQVQLTRGEELVNLDALDQKLWVALACPTKGLAIDARTLELLDTDKDGRIRANELIAAAKWAGSLLTNVDDLVKAPKELLLSSLNESTDEGKNTAKAARTILSSLGKANASSLTVADTVAAVKAFEALPFNGDGVVTEASAADEPGKQLVRDVLATVGGVPDKSGAQGVNVAKVDEFFKEVAAHAEWLGKRAGVVGLSADAALAAFDTVKAVRAKVDDYFARCRLAAFDARSLGALNREEKDYLAFTQKELTLATAEILALPLARVEAGRALPLSETVNPAWVAAVAAFATQAVTPVLGAQGSLTEAGWASVLAAFAPLEAWLGGKAGGVVEKLGAPRITALAKADARAPLDALLVKEKEQEPIAASLASVEKLARLTRDLYRVATNFVSFREFYERKSPAIFQAGTLYLDQRACELCIRVEDAGKHGTMAPLSRAYLAYCDCVRAATGQKMSIVAAFTAGDSDNLMVGRNGIFYDHEGNDWDATVTKLVDNPISIRQAFWSPYKKVIRFVEAQVAKRATEADKSSNELLTTGATSAAKAAETGKAEPVAPKKFDVGVVAALGVAVGGITAALGAILQSFFGLGLWMPLGIVGIILLISGPSMLIAWLKLRQRNIGPLLDANGWAVNANARLNVPFGASLTRVAALPTGARVDTRDPFEEHRKPWGLYLTLVVVLSLGLAWYLGKLDGLLPLKARSVEVLGSAAPAFKAEPKTAADVPPATK